MSGVWWSSLRETPSCSWPRVIRARTMGSEPSVHARCNEVLERPVGELSGFWIKSGWDLRMRVRRRGSEA
jgi:hypothetical protein